MKNSEIPRKGSPGRSVDQNASMGQLFHRMFLVVMVFLLVPWTVYLWEASTGLTFAGRRSGGQVSTAAHLAHTRKVAFRVVILLGPVAVGLWFAQKRYEDA